MVDVLGYEVNAERIHAVRGQFTLHNDIWSRESLLVLDALVKQRDTARDVAAARTVEVEHLREEAAWLVDILAAVGPGSLGRSFVERVRRILAAHSDDHRRELLRTADKMAGLMAEMIEILVAIGDDSTQEYKDALDAYRQARVGLGAA